MRSIVKIYEKKKLIKFIIILLKQLDNGFRALWLGAKSPYVQWYSPPSDAKLAWVTNTMAFLSVGG